MTITEATARKILAATGFEIDDTEETFVPDVTALINAGDREGLINRIAGGASYEEAAMAADEILEKAIRA